MKHRKTMDYYKDVYNYILFALSHFGAKNKSLLLVG